MLHWMKYTRKLSAYRDHSLPAEEFRTVWSHLYHCAECRETVSGIEQLGLALRRLPSPAVPEDLLPEIRIRVSQERARQDRPGLLWRLGNQWGHLALPGAAGLLSAVMIFCVFASHFSVPPRAAASPVVPLELRTPARLRDGQPLKLDTKMGDLVVQLVIDPQGRVADYYILAGTYTAEDMRNLRNSLLFAVFDPATFFGLPTSGTLVVSNIRG